MSRTRGNPYHPVMALELRDITVRLGDRDVLRSFDAAFASGSLTVILGPNGAGKSTLLRTIIGAIDAVRGSVKVNGNNLDREHAARGRIAYVAQRSTVEFSFTARDVIGFGGYAGQVDTRAIEFAMDKTGTTALADRPFNELSVGQQQRVSIARALAQIGAQRSDLSGCVLLADEPVASLDPAHALAALELMQDLARRGACVIIVMHDLTTALRLADHVAVLDQDGTLAGFGTPSELMRTGVLQRVYDIELNAADSTVVLPARKVVDSAEPGISR